MPTIVSFIPDRFKKGFEDILSFNNDEFNKIKNALISIKPVYALESLVSEISTKNEKNYDSLYGVFLSIGSLSPYLEEGKVSHILNDIVDISIKDNLINGKDKDRFKERVSFLLENKQIFYAARGQDLISEYKNIFLRSRVVTDIRPVFSLNVEEDPECGMIIHNLHIHFQSDRDDGISDIYFSLDQDDLQTLKDTLERAEKKAETLSRVLVKSNMIKLL